MKLPHAGRQDVLLAEIVMAIEVSDGGPAQHAGLLRHLERAQLHRVGVQVLGAQRGLPLAVLDVRLGVLGEELDLARARRVAVVPRGGGEDDIGVERRLLALLRALHREHDADRLLGLTATLASAISTVPAPSLTAASSSFWSRLFSSSKT